MKLEQLWRVVVTLSVAVKAQYGQVNQQASTALAVPSSRVVKELMLPWGTLSRFAEREPTCIELRSMWRHTRRIIRNAASDADIKQLPSFVNSLEYAFAPKFLQFWHSSPPRQGPKASLPFGRMLLTKTKSKRPPPDSLSLVADTKYQVLPGQKTPRAPANVGLGGIGYFHEDDEGGELTFQDPTAEIDGVPREEDFGRYGTIVRSPEEKAKLRREFLLSTANRLGKGINSLDTYRIRSKLEVCREKVENAPCRNDADCFCSRSVHPYTCHETLGVCTKKGGMQVLRDTYGRWYQRPFDARELGYNDEVANDL